MPISENDVTRVAHLARLLVTEAEIPQYQAGLDGILDLVAQLHESVTDDIEPMAHPQDISLRLREDQVTEDDERDLFQECAPAVESGLYLVPRVIE